MKNKTTRLLSVLLACIMALGLFPTVAFADDVIAYPVCVLGTRVTSGNAADVLENGTVSWDNATSTLTLNNADLTVTKDEYSAGVGVTTGPGILGGCIINFDSGEYSQQVITINLIGTNKITSTGISNLAGGINSTVTTDPSKAKPGDIVTITTQPEDRFEPDAVTVTDENGNDTPVTKNEDGTYSFTMPKGKVTVTVTFKEKNHDCPSQHLKDVNPSSWYHEYIDYVVEKSLMQGVAADQFAPNIATTRAMIVTILYRLEGEPAVSGTSSFDDVEAGSWYADAVAWAEENNIVEGYGHGRFGPMDPITREQLATILYRYVKTNGGGFGDTPWAFKLPFRDEGNVSEWAYEPMCWWYSNGVIQGKEDNFLDPQGKATRAEAAAILMRFIEK